MSNWKYIHNEIYIYIDFNMQFLCNSRTAEATNASQQCHGIYTISTKQDYVTLHNYNSHTICSLGKH